MRPAANEAALCVLPEPVAMGCAMEGEEQGVRGRKDDERREDKVHVAAIVSMMVVVMYSILLLCLPSLFLSFLLPLFRSGRSLILGWRTG